jgi:hypothetical protein
VSLQGGTDLYLDEEDGNNGGDGKADEDWEHISSGKFKWIYVTDGSYRDEGHGTSVPPPTHMPAICPRAVRVATPVPMLSANKFATEPASEIPENPEPSSPVMAPTTVNVTAATALDRGTTAARDASRSFTIP